jgi:hypothetical protein
VTRPARNDAFVEREAQGAQRWRTGETQTQRGAGASAPLSLCRAVGLFTTVTDHRGGTDDKSYWAKAAFLYVIRAPLHVISGWSR